MKIDPDSPTAREIERNYQRHIRDAFHALLGAAHARCQLKGLERLPYGDYTVTLCVEEHGDDPVLYEMVKADYWQKVETVAHLDVEWPFKEV